MINVNKDLQWEMSSHRQFYEAVTDTLESTSYTRRGAEARIGLLPPVWDWQGSFPSGLPHNRGMVCHRFGMGEGIVRATGKSPVLSAEKHRKSYTIGCND